MELGFSTPTKTNKAFHPESGLYSSEINAHSSFQTPIKGHADYDIGSLSHRDLTSHLTAHIKPYSLHDDLQKEKNLKHNDLTITTGLKSSHGPTPLASSHARELSFSHYSPSHVDDHSSHHAGSSTVETGKVSLLAELDEMMKRTSLYKTDNVYLSPRASRRDDVSLSAHTSHHTSPHRDDDDAVEKLRTQELFNLKSRNESILKSIGGHYQDLHQTPSRVLTEDPLSLTQTKNSHVFSKAVEPTYTTHISDYQVHETPVHHYPEYSTSTFAEPISHHVETIHHDSHLLSSHFEPKITYHYPDGEIREIHEIHETPIHHEYSHSTIAHETLKSSVPHHVETVHHDSHLLSSHFEPKITYHYPDGEIREFHETPIHHEYSHSTFEHEPSVTYHTYEPHHTSHHTYSHDNDGTHHTLEHSEKLTEEMTNKISHIDTLIQDIKSRNTRITNTLSNGHHNVDLHHDSHHEARKRHQEEGSFSPALGNHSEITHRVNNCKTEKVKEHKVAKKISHHDTHFIVKAVIAMLVLLLAGVLVAQVFFDFE